MSLSDLNRLSKSSDSVDSQNVEISTTNTDVLEIVSHALYGLYGHPLWYHFENGLINRWNFTGRILGRSNPATSGLNSLPHALVLVSAARNPKRSQPCLSELIAVLSVPAKQVSVPVADLGFLLTCPLCGYEL